MCLCHRLYEKRWTPASIGNELRMGYSYFYCCISSYYVIAHHTKVTWWNACSLYPYIDESKGKNKERMKKRNNLWNQSVYCFFPSLCLCLYDFKWSVDIQMMRTKQKTEWNEKKEFTTIKSIHHQFEINKKRRRRNRTLRMSKIKTILQQPRHTLTSFQMERDEKNVPSQIFIWMTERNRERPSERRKKKNKLTDFKQMKHKWKSKTTTNPIDRTEWIKKKNAF